MKKIISIILLFQYLGNYAQINFQEHNVLGNSTATISEPELIISSDLDGDGDLDVISGSGFGSKIVWYTNDGQGNFDTSQIITTEVGGFTNFYAIDIDGDGDIDLLFSSFADSKIVWCENIDGQGNFGSQQIISTSVNGIVSVFASDIDNDGYIDVLSAGANKILWYKNINGQGDFGSQQIITSNISQAHQVIATDFDNDGYIDVLSASRNNHEIVWYKNINGQGDFESQQIITTDAIHIRSINIADIDGDGFTDVLSASVGDNKIAWYKNINGQGDFGSQQIISTNVLFPQSVYASDIDNDGDIDVISSSSNDGKIAWYENTDGQGNFGSQQVIANNLNGTSSVFSSDIDGDGDMDVLATSPTSLVWMENTDGEGNFGGNNSILPPTGNPFELFTVDIDNDGDLDLLYPYQGLAWGSTLHKIVWQENLDGLGNFSGQKVISPDYSGRIFPTDIDGDGDKDILAYIFQTDNLVWYKNDGHGNFSIPFFILNFDTVFSIFSSDMDNDGDNDILLSLRYPNFNSSVVWYENTNGQGNFSNQRIIESTTSHYYKPILTANIDGDNYTDVLTLQNFGEQVIKWHRNDAGLFNNHNIIISDDTNTFFESLYTNDIDGDGDTDVLSASYNDGEIAWYENTNGEGDFGEERVITINVFGANSVFAVDIDGDGDIDVLSASEGDDIIAWYENINGEGDFGELQVISSNLSGAQFVTSCDIDNDGDLDVFATSESGQIVYYENLGSPLGVEQFNTLNFLIYPNPTKNNIFIKSKSEIAKIEIYTNLGTLVLFNLDKDNIDISSLHNGLYFIKIKDKNGFSEIKKILKK